MSSIDQDDNQLFQNSISYLNNISTLNFTTPTLKCLYLTKARLMELRKSLQLPRTSIRTTVKCQRCLLNLAEGPASYRIKSEKRKSKFAKRMLGKTEQEKSLTKYQTKYYKRLSGFSGNQLEITCKFCKKESLVKLEKPKRPIHPKIVETKSVKKRKVKKKDRFCGLSQEVVLSLTPQNVRNFDTSIFIPLETSDKKKSQRFKLSKKENLKVTQKNVTTKINIIENRKKLKRKDKLKEFLNINPSKSSPSTNLKQFLQSL